MGYKKENFSDNKNFLKTNEENFINKLQIRQINNNITHYFSSQ